MVLQVSIDTHLLDLDSAARDFTIRGRVTAEWVDDRLVWDTRWGLTSLAIPITGEWPDLYTHVWRPILRPARCRATYANARC